MMSKFWLYLGILLACSGIGTGLGIFLIVLYVWADIKESINNNAVNSIDEENYNPNFYSKETAEEITTKKLVMLHKDLNLKIIFLQQLVKL
jgi:hypothetical protein